MEEKSKLTLYGCESSNIAGYCKLHNVSLTPKQIRAHNCLQKQCWHLEKNEKHRWWTERASMKEKRRARKEYYNSLGKDD